MVSGRLEAAVCPLSERQVRKETAVARKQQETANRDRSSNPGQGVLSNSTWPAPYRERTPKHRFDSSRARELRLAVFEEAGLDAYASFKMSCGL